MPDSNAIVTGLGYHQTLTPGLFGDKCEIQNWPKVTPVTKAERQVDSRNIYGLGINSPVYN